jgi:putative ABC transport system ATP-binding protein
LLNPYPAIRLSPNKTILFSALTLNAARQNKIILIIQFLYMNKLLKLSRVNLSYNTDNNLINVLQDVSFEVDYKETISIVGESGSGKTSLIMLIGGLEKASSGKIQFKEFEISNLKEDQISEIRRKKIGIVFQSFYLIPNYTALENVSLTLEINKIQNPEQKAKEILDRFGLDQRLNNLPSQLSGGEQQRVAIARSIAMKPQLILADEPTGNLDSENSNLISKILFDYVNEEKASLIIVTHDNNLASQTKRKIKIKDGRIE